MKRTIIRLLSLLLSLSLCLGMLPVVAWAETATDSLGYLTYKVSGGEVTITKCNTSASGSMFIPATIEDYPVTAIARYAFFNCTNLTSVILPGSITSIGTHAFSGCSNLISVNIPSNVTFIDSNAFYKCSSLTGITIPDSVTYIGASAFSDCDSLTSIAIPSSITTINSNTFESCNQLSIVAIPNSVTIIDSGAFRYCTSLTSIAIPASVTTLGSYAFENCTGLTDFIIPGSVTKVSNGTFSKCSYLSSISIPSSVTSIGDFAFEHCTSLTDITIPSSVTTLGQYAFAGCTALTDLPSLGSIATIDTATFRGCTGLTEITIPDKIITIADNAFENCTGITSITIPDSVTSIGNYAFDSCTGLTHISIPGNVTTIGNYAFDGCTGLTGVTILDGVTSIGYRAFHSCTGLTNISIPCSIISIDDSAFSGCSGLTRIDLPTSITSINSAVFDGCTGLTHITIPDSITIIDSSAFCGCTGLTHITIPDSVTTIGDGAFYGCTGLTEITIPYSVTALGGSAFKKCTGLTHVIIPDRITSIDDRTFENCTRLTGITIQGRITAINSYAFSGCTELDDITIPDSVIEIGSYAFQNCTSLTEITIPDSVTSIGAYGFSGCTGLKEVTIPDGVTSIGNYAFSRCTGLTDVTLTNGITSIGKYTFSDCSKLNHVFYTGTQEQWETVTYYTSNNELLSATNHTNCAGNDYTYTTYCTAIHKRCNLCNNVIDIIPGGTEHLLNGDVCTICGLHKNLKYTISRDGQVQITGFNTSWSEELVIPNLIEGCPVTSIGSSAFKNCSTLTGITIPECVTSIGSDAFSGCTGLQKVSIQDISAWCSIQFSGCASNPLYYADTLCLNGVAVTDLIIPEGVTNIGNYVFSGCDMLSNVTIPDGVTTIGNYAFYECTGLTGIPFPDSATAVGNSAFESCTGLIDITLPSSIVTIGKSAFKNCTSLTGIILPDGITDIGDSAFEKCTSLSSIIIPDSITTINYRAFHNCTGLTAITIPDSVTSIEYNAFEYCSNLTRLDIQNLGAWCNIEFGGYASNPLYYAKKLYLNGTPVTDLIIPDGTTCINDYAFCNFTGLTDITIPDSVTSIDAYAFSGCSKLNHVFYTGTQTQWEAIASISGNTILSACTLHTDYKGNGSTITEYCTTTRKQCNLCGEMISTVSKENGHQFVNNVCTVCGISDCLSYTVSNSGEITITSCDTSFTGKLTIPGTIDGCPVIKIGNAAFKGCSKLTGIRIPDSVTQISDNAFYSCTNLTTVTIGEGVTYIGSYAFSGTNLNHVFYAGTQEQWEAISIKSGNTLLTSSTVHTECKDCEYTCTTYCTLTIKRCDLCDDIISSESGGNGHQFVENVCTVCGSSDLLEYTVSSAGEVTITGCDASITGELIIPDTIESCPVTAIGSKAFMNCVGLTNITIPEGVTGIGSQAFSGCTGLTNITIPGSVTVIDSYAFYKCIGLTSFAVPDSVTEIDNYAFQNCTNMTDIYIGSGVTQIGYNVFSRCSMLNHVFYAGSQAQWDAIDIQYGNTVLTDSTVHADCNTAAYTIADFCTVTRKLCDLCGEPISSVSGGAGHQFVDHLCTVCGISDLLEYAVSSTGEVTITGCDASITGELIIPNAIEGCPVTAIGNSAFQNCTSLTGITIADSVTCIDWYAFQNCTSLISVDMPDCLTGIGGYAFSGCSSLTSIAIPQSITKIDRQAFYDCAGLTSVDIQNIEAWCKIQFVDYASNPLYFAHALCLNDSPVTQLIIPDSITTIGDYVFRNCTGLSSVSIPNSVTDIGRYAFADCTGLTDMNIPGSVTSIGASAFYNCTGLTDMTIPDSVTSIGASAFHNCTGLTEFTIPDSVTSIGPSLFYNCTGLTDITIPDSVTSIGASAFYNCTGLTEFTIPDSVTTIGELAFRNCTGLTGIVIPDSVTSMGRYMFSECTGLTSVTIGSGITEITDYAFEYCSGLTNITIPDNVTSIGYCAFKSCGNLSSIAIGNSVTTVENYAFDSCGNLTHVFYAGTQEQWDAITVGIDNDRLESATVHANCEGSAFTDTTYCTAIHRRCDLCNDIISILPGGSGHSLSGDVCTICGLHKDLKHTISRDGKARITGFNTSWAGQLMIPVTIEGCPVAEISSYAFRNCTGLTGITIPESITKIDSQAFYNCTGLSNVDIQDIGAWCNIQFVDHGSNPLYHAKALYLNGTPVTELIVPEGVTGIGSYAFYNCTGLTQVTIPDSVTNIGSHAFANCDGLVSVTVQGQITDAGDSVFDDCDHLREFIFQADAPADLFLSVTADVCYPEDNSSWTELVLDDYSGNLKFYAIDELVDLKMRQGTYLTGYPVEADDVYFVAVYSNGVERPLHKDLYTFTPIDTSFAHADTTDISYHDLTVTHDVYIHDGHEVPVDPALYPYPESSHPYYSNTYDVQTFTVPGAHSLILTFSEKTRLHWDEKAGGDDIMIYDGQGERVAWYNDDEAAGQTLTVKGDTVTVLLSTENEEWRGEVRKYGYAFSQIKALMAAHTTIPGTEPTCIEEGLTIGYDCDICDYRLPQQVIPALGHDYVSVVTPATPTSNGYTTHTCRRCGHTYIDGYTAYKQLAGGVQDGLYWILHENGTLEIGGSGYMRNFISGGAPWYEHINEVLCIQVNNGVNNIGAYAFENCANAVSITLGTSVTVIGEKAFLGCEALDHRLYMGTQQQWEAIIVGNDNQLLNTPVMHFDCTGNEIDNSLSCTEHLIQCTICEKVLLQRNGIGHSYEEGYCIRCGQQSPRDVIVAGTVTSFGDASAQITVTLSAPGEDETVAEAVVIGNKAHYALENVAPGTYELTVNKEGHATIVQSLTVTDQPLTLDMTLRLYGDITGDGKITVADVSKLYAHVKRTTYLTDPYILLCADMSGDGRISVADVSMLYSIVRNKNK